jgi:hypothetical protein
VPFNSGAPAIALDDEGTRKRLIELANDLPEKSRRGQQALRHLRHWLPNLL